MGIMFVIFKFPFGPVEMLGTTVFIGLSINYVLHTIHAYQYSESKTRKEKVRDAMLAVGSPITGAAVSTFGACAFLLGCRVYLFRELGIMLCSIILMSYLYSIFFIPSVLSSIGPLPYAGEGNLHQYDIIALLTLAWRNRVLEKDTRE